jgi:polyisoprenoid-binding protein YceI
MIKARTCGVWGLVWTAGVLAGGASVNAADNYKIDPVHSCVRFRVKHLGVSYMYGRFNDVSGDMTIDSEDAKKSSINVTIKAKSVYTNDEGRDKHLRGPDFFSAKEFPVITFKSTKIKKSGKHALKVTGDLTLHGVTKSITVKLEHVGEGDNPRFGYRSGYETTFTIKRSDYGMGYMAGNGMLGDEVRVEISIEGMRK